jgi:15-cis-phytoene synthase
MQVLAQDAARIASDDAACAALVRAADIDRYYSTLFAPPAKRAALLALYAFNAEIAQISQRVTDPLPGEVRLQWWRDAMAAGGEEADGASTGQGHPVAAALERCIRAFRLPRGAFDRLIEARIFDLYHDPMPTMAELEGYAGDTSSALIQLACLILAEGDDPASATAAGHAGVACALTGLLRGFGHHAARGQIFLPADRMAHHAVTREAVLAGEAEPGLAPLLAEMRAAARTHLGAMRAAMAGLDRRLWPAFLPVALCRLCLARMERPGHDPFRGGAEPLPLAKLWAMARAKL